MWPTNELQGCQVENPLTMPNFEINEKENISLMCANKLRVNHFLFLNIEDLCDPFPSTDYINFIQLQAKIPSNYHETICHIGCRTKMQDEYNSIVKNNTWDLMVLPTN